MLIRFVVENFKSFKEETDFNLLTGSVTKHANHVHHTKQGIDVLPISVIYGGNASGKTNLIEAIFRARNIIVDGTVSKTTGFPIEKFVLENANLDKSVKFEFEFKTHKNAYSYGFVLDYDRVIEEWLYLISANKGDKSLFTREKNTFKFGESLTHNKKELEFLENETKGLRINQLFISESYRREIGFFDDILEWFQKLMIIFPEQKYGKLQSFLNENHLRFTNDLLKIGDIGISVKTKYENYQDLINKYPNIREEVTTRYAYIRKNGFSFKVEKEVYSIFFDKKLKEMQAVKLMAIHSTKEGKEIYFKLPQESDGTQRLIDLSGGIYPAIFEDRVVIIDEIDRNIHPLLSKKLIEIFIQKRVENGGTGQLICTTHEDLMIDLNLLRSDEICFVQKNDEGASEIYPLSDFNIEDYNIDVRMGYLNGRFGGIPHLKDAVATS